MRFATMLMVLTPLMGCAQYDAARNANLAAAAQARVAADDAACRTSGAQPGSPAYEDCRRRLLNQHASQTHSQEKLANEMLNESSLRPIGQ
jgi:hypothetical protein